MRKISLTLVSLLTLVLLVSWGGAGHYRISEMAGIIFTGEMFEFNNWLPYIADHASDADDRKSYDYSEGPKHYIDIDNYPSFESEGRIPQTLDSCIKIYGASFVEEQGYLPWATKTSYDTLVACFIRHDWDKAKVTTADLSHYVADGHMPLHITRNYNGQYTDNYGIHSRYESYMVGRFISQLFYTPQPYHAVDDVQAYIFSYLYKNNTFVDTIMNADSFAQEEAGDDGSSLYYQLLWEGTSYLTENMFSQASTALVSLIFQAWTDAGKPAFNSPLEEEPEETGISSNEIQVACYPNPFASEVNICFTVNDPDTYGLFITDDTGRILADLTVPDANGEQKVTWMPGNSAAGTLFVVYRDRSVVKVQKIVYRGNN